MKVHLPDAGHMTKMAAMPIYGKNTLKIFFLGTSRLISTKLDMIIMKHRRLKPLMITGLTLT